MMKHMSVEFILPDNANVDALSEIFHNAFKGNEDYIESRIVIHNHQGCAGITMFDNEIADKEDMKARLKQAFDKFIEEI